MSGVQWAVLAFFGAVWVALAVILVVAPDIYSTTAPSIPPVALLAAVSVIIGVCVVGTVRRWTWVFWIIEIAFLAGALRIAASGLAFAGVISQDGPRWYVALQGVIGAIQLAIGIAMLQSYRRAGIWGRASER